MTYERFTFTIWLMILTGGTTQADSIIGEWTGVSNSGEHQLAGGFEIDLSEKGVFYIDDQPVTSLMIDEFEINETNFKEYHVARVWYLIDGVRNDPSTASILQIRDQLENHAGFTAGDFFRVLNADYIFTLTDPGDHTESPLLSSHDLPLSNDDFSFDGFDFTVFSSVRAGVVDGYVTSFDLHVVPEPTGVFFMSSGFLLPIRCLRRRRQIRVGARGSALG